jgi:hypothetical protein
VKIRLAISVTAALVSLMATPVLSFAAEGPQGSASVPSTAPGGTTYNLSFMLPTLGKSGCLVCHGDTNLAKVGVDTTSTMYVDIEAFKLTAHADTLCTGCHSDFAMKTPHKNAADDKQWRKTARTECKTCHSPQSNDYSEGSHSPANANADASKTLDAEDADADASVEPTRAPLCGDCHDGHNIPSKDDTPAVRAYQASGVELCGGCHEEFANNYRDYYHGAAYQRGAPDAPACWDCHGAHLVLPASDRKSPVNPANLIETCGQPGCHKGVDERFVEYASLVHGRREAYQAIPFVSVWSTAAAGVNQAIEAVRGLFD